MTTKQDIIAAAAEEFRQWLNEEIQSAKEDCMDNKDYPNSYGAGYDSGKLNALLDARTQFITFQALAPQAPESEG